MEDKPNTPDLDIEFAKQLERIQAKLATPKSHARGPKRPNLGQQDERDS